MSPASSDMCFSSGKGGRVLESIAIEQSKYSEKLVKSFCLDLV